MLNPKNILLLFSVIGITLPFSPAKAEGPSLTEQYVQAKLTYIDLKVLAHYYKESPEIANAITDLETNYLNMCIAGQLLELMRLAQSAIYQLNEPEYAETRFNHLLEFLDQVEEGEGYIQLLAILAKAKRHDAIRNYSLLVRVLYRFAYTIGLTGEHPVDQLKGACERIASDTLFINNRADTLQFIRDAFNDAEGQDGLGHIQQVVEALEERFAGETRTLFAAIHNVLPTLMETPLPPSQQANPSAREARRHLFQRAVQFQEILRPPSLRNQDPFLNRNPGESALRARVGGRTSGISSRL